MVKDSVYTTHEINSYSLNNEINRFRVFRKQVYLKGKIYLLIIKTNMEEGEETFWIITQITFTFFTILIVGFWFLSRKLSYKLWMPFRDTLQKLKSFQLNSKSKLTFTASNTVEFEELNQAVLKLMNQNRAVFQSQKEFTENASHELQTPLAIIKTKLDLLIQDQHITKNQYDLAEQINEALNRITRLNRNLLLLSKIENHQFTDKKMVAIDEVLMATIKHLEDFFNDKELLLKLTVESNVKKSCNLTLLEILLTNLLLNAIRYSKKKSIVEVSLSTNQLIISNDGLASLDKDKLFLRFSNPTKKTSGTGLGLNIVQQVCIQFNWECSYLFKENKHVFIVQL